MAKTPNKLDYLPPVTYAPRAPRLRRPPFIFVAVGLVSVVASWVPLVLAARARTVNTDETHIAFVQDMGVQPKSREQQTSTVFADGRADRLPVQGTIARGHLEEDDHYYRGYDSTLDIKKDKNYFYDSFPDDVKVNKALLERGQNRFNIYCSVCHGYDGQGHGSVNERAKELMAKDADDTKWTPAFDLTSSAVAVRPVGHIYNTINVGIRSMPPYGAQIPVADRWAIVAYVRALQLSENAPASMVPATQPAAK